MWLLIKRLEPFVHHIKTILLFCRSINAILLGSSFMPAVKCTPLQLAHLPCLPSFSACPNIKPNLVPRAVGKRLYKTHWDQKVKYWQFKMRL